VFASPPLRHVAIIAYRARKPPGWMIREPGQGRGETMVLRYATHGAQPAIAPEVPR
jgi:hypothetical protein